MSPTVCLTWLCFQQTVFGLNVQNMSVLASLFVCRALFDYDGSASDLSTSNQALPFHFGDILHVSSAGEEEWWPARHLSPPPPNCPEVGVIPSRRRSEFKLFWFLWAVFLLYFTSVKDLTLPPPLLITLINHKSAEYKPVVQIDLLSHYCTWH